MQAPGLPEPGLLGLSCPVVSGNSGAPLLQAHGTGWQIAAIMVASGRPGPGLGRPDPRNIADTDSAAGGVRRGWR